MAMIIAQSYGSLCRCYHQDKDDKYLPGNQDYFIGQILREGQQSDIYRMSMSSMHIRMTTVFRLARAP